MNPLRPPVATKLLYTGLDVETTACENLFVFILLCNFVYIVCKVRKNLSFLVNAKFSAFVIYWLSVLYVYKKNH